MKRSELILGVLRVPLDYILGVAALVSAYFLRAGLDQSAFFKQIDFLSFPPFEVYLNLAVVGALIYSVVLALLGSYRFKRPRSFSSELKTVLVGAIVWLMVIISYYFFIREFPFSRLVFLLATFFMGVFVSCGRAAIRLLRQILLRFGIGKRWVVIVGLGESAKKLADYFRNSKNFIVVAQVGSFEKLTSQSALKGSFTELYHTSSDKLEAQQIIDYCREHHIEYHFVPEVMELHRSDYSMITMGGVPVITLSPSPLEGWQRVIKRIFDIVFSFIGLVVLSPFFALIAIIIKFDSPGTIFFRYLDDGRKATRIGERGRHFCCLKFRTMKSKTHNMRYTDLSEKNTRKGSPLVKIKDDPRVTRVGRFLRRYSIDELPQLWNVLIGEMSLVGPRPHLPEEVANYKSYHKFVLTLKPGITGLAQINGRSDLDFEQEVRLDTFYIENWSLWLDIKILFKTVGVVLKPYKE